MSDRRTLLRRARSESFSPRWNHRAARCHGRMRSPAPSLLRRAAVLPRSCRTARRARDPPARPAPFAPGPRHMHARHSPGPRPRRQSDLAWAKVAGQGWPWWPCVVLPAKAVPDGDATTRQVAFLIDGTTALVKTGAILVGAPRRASAAVWGVGWGGVPSSLPSPLDQTLARVGPAAARSARAPPSAPPPTSAPPPSTPKPPPTHTHTYLPPLSTPIALYSPSHRTTWPAWCRRHH